MVNAQFGSDDLYDECMRRAGFDTTEDGGGYNGLVYLIRESAPSNAVIVDHGESSDAWVAYLAFEQRALHADRSCRLARHIDAMSELAPALDAFEQEHSKEIADIREGWRRIVEDATSQGWAELLRQD